MYDFLLVGTGLYNAVVAYELLKRGYKCLALEAREHIGGNCYTENVDGIIVHKYGAHIFRTSDYFIWNYMQQFTTFNHFINSPIAKYKNEIYNLPFNMNTFSKMWNISTPEQAEKIIRQQSAVIKKEPSNLEEHAIKLVGTDIYEKLIKGYTEKQWGRSCRELPASIMRRIPLRFIYDNNYFSDPYQGIPIGGYTLIIEKMFQGCKILYNINYNEDRTKYREEAKYVIYTGTIDSYFDYKYGPLEYRSLEFRTEKKNIENYQGVAVVNYTDVSIPYTRIIEHKHFEFGKQPNTIISKEYPIEWKEGTEPYYPINDYKNNELYKKYFQESKKEHGVYFGGRLGSYKYTDMQDTIKDALKFIDMLKNTEVIK